LSRRRNLSGSVGDDRLLFEQLSRTFSSAGREPVERWAAGALETSHPHGVATSREGPEGAGMVEQCSRERFRIQA